MSKSKCQCGHEQAEHFTRYAVGRFDKCICPEFQPCVEPEPPRTLEGLGKAMALSADASPTMRIDQHREMYAIDEVCRAKLDEILAILKDGKYKTGYKQGVKDNYEAGRD
jgi:hypothetical protein